MKIPGGGGLLPRRGWEGGRGPGGVWREFGGIGGGVLKIVFRAEMPAKKKGGLQLQISR